MLALSREGETSRERENPFSPWLLCSGKADCGKRVVKLRRWHNSEAKKNAWTVNLTDSRVGSLLWVARTVGDYSVTPWLCSSCLILLSDTIFQNLPVQIRSNHCLLSIAADPKHIKALFVWHNRQVKANSWALMRLKISALEQSCLTVDVGLVLPLAVDLGMQPNKVAGN